MHDHRITTGLVAALLAFVLVVAVPAATATGVAPAAADPAPRVTYRSPVDAPVVEGFDLPDGPYGRGNRGLDYGTEAGTSVRAAAEGEVIFAGPVAGSLHVTVLHPDGLRTSYSFLASIGVRAGQLVSAGQAVGTSGVRLHVGVRDGTDAYLDPALLFSGTFRPRSVLIPGAEEGRAALAARERRSLRDLVESVGAAVLPGVAGAPTRLAVLGHYAVELQPLVRAGHLVEGYRRWRDSRGRCTPASVTPLTPPGRRVLVLVAGFGSTSDAAGVDKVDAAALGYAPSDVVRFSYNGGRIPADGLAPGLDHLTSSPYGPADSQQDLIVAADRLRALLQEVADAEPGVPIDVVAHSQGGVVGRVGLLRADADGSLPDTVETLVTVSSPHGGADLATALHGLAGVSGAESTLAAVQEGLGLRLDANSAAVAELSEVAPLTRDVRDRGVPDAVNFVSIGARGDLVVANPRTVVAGEAAVTVDVGGVHAHDEVPGSSAVTREIGLAVAGLAPTCSSFADTTLDLVVGESVSYGTDLLGAGGLVLAAPLP